MRVSGFLAVLGPVVALAACESSGTVCSCGAPPPAFELASPDVKYLGDHALLDAYFWTTVEPQLQFSFTGRNGDSSIGFVAYLSIETLTSKTATVTVTSGPIAVGRANMSADGAPNAPGFEDATASMTFAPGTVIGEIVTAGALARWTFQGKLLAGCAVPPSALPTPCQNGCIVDGSAETIVPDDKLETPQCQPIRTLANP
jgi:hypothetical protein